MKAVRAHRFGGPKVMVREDVPDPKPEAGQVLVRVKAVGVNPVDTYVRTGIPGRMPPLPYTPGSDAAGTGEAGGSGGTGRQPGGRGGNLPPGGGAATRGATQLA